MWSYLRGLESTIRRREEDLGFDGRSDGELVEEAERLMARDDETVHQEVRVIFSMNSSDMNLTIRRNES